MSFGVVVFIYLIYNRINTTPLININRSDANDFGIHQSDGETGRIGDVGIDIVRKAEFLDFDENKNVVGKFGFEKLLHETGGQWEIEKPYRNIFRSDFDCFITADSGSVSIDTQSNRPSPKDATLRENVVIHILPKSGNRQNQSTIYLDDISFISSRSLFTTAGPVRFVSENSEMTGRGLELVYDDQADRLEYLRIIDLHQLKVSTKENSDLLSSANQAEDKSASPKVADGTERSEKAAPQEVYRCVFSGNVMIDSPAQKVFANQVFINDIGSSQSPGEQSDEAYTEDSQPNEPGQANEPNESFVDILVNCDNGIIIIPMETEWKPELFALDVNSTRKIEQKVGLTTFAADTIDYSVTEENIVAAGPLELTFYVNGPSGKKTEKDAVPVIVKASQRAEFQPELNRVVFQGNSLCSMVEDYADYRQSHRLSSDTIEVNLCDDASEIETVNAVGGIVRLSTIKKTGDKLLGGTELKCTQFHFDNTRQTYLAHGPGVIKINNSDMSQPDTETRKFSLRKPCWAAVDNFDRLKYDLQKNHITADSQTGQINIDYIPILAGEYGEPANLTASHIEADLTEKTDGRSEIASLHATGGITYLDAEKHFVGSEMFFDAENSMITAQGNDFWPCLLNGTQADAIEYNLKTGKAKTRILAPGQLRIKN